MVAIGNYWELDLRISRFALIIIHDSMMAVLAYLASLYLRVGDSFGLHLGDALAPCFMLLILSLLTHPFMGLHKTLWNFVSISDLVKIAKSSVIITLSFLVVMFLYNRLEGVPRTSFMTYILVYNFLIAGPRILFRLLKDKSFDFTGKLLSTKKIPIILIGISENSEHFLRQTTSGRNSEYEVVAIIDPDKKRHGSYIHNIKIYGGLDMISSIYNKLKKKLITPQKMIIGIDLDGPLMRNILEIADSRGMTIGLLPKLSDFRKAVENKLEIRPIVIEDLLGRAQRRLNQTLMHSMINNKTILVTGAGGTIGSELAVQIASFGPSKLILLDISEYNIYVIDRKISELYCNLNKTSIIGDIRNERKIEEIFAQFTPDIVFHAAALKHVPLVENNQAEGILTNIFGTKIIAENCLKYKTSKMILISTDKAVNPTNIMGATKRIAENLLQIMSQQSTDTNFVTVRFGNVLGSSGSVIPLFERQIKAGGPITVTHPDMVRYFMTVREAVELVIQAASAAEELSKSHNSIFVLDMGEPVRILDLAHQMVRMSGLKLNEDIRVEFTGLRPGEKLFEELFYGSEELEKTELEATRLAKAKKVDHELINKQLAKLKKYCMDNSKFDKIKTLLKEIISEYQPN